MSYVMNQSEILVHVSAPSGAIDDARYRAQVEAFLNFQSHSREIIPLSNIEQQPLSSSSLPCVPTDLLILSHPQTTPRAITPARRDSQGDSLASLVSVIPDSQPQILDTGFDGLDHFQPSPVPSPRIGPSTAPFSSLGTPSSKRCRIDSPPPPRFNRGSRNYLSEAKQRHTTTGSPEHRHCAFGAGPPALPVHNLSTPVSTSQPEDQVPPSKTGPGLVSLPLEIRPPLPPISTAKFLTHITPTLSMLAGRLSSSRIYNPIKQSRDLDKLERGYWFLYINLIEPSGSAASPPNPELPRDPDTDTGQCNLTTNNGPDWDRASFTYFWSFLSDFIAKEGRAGWGVWCILDDAPSLSPSLKIKTSQWEAPKANNGLTQRVALKVYAWGEIARHIYLLLFLASDRRIRRMGAQWRDSRDEVIIEMP